MKCEILQNQILNFCLVVKYLEANVKPQTLFPGNRVKDLETDVIHLVAKISNFLLVLNSSVNFAIYLSIDTKYHQPCAHRHHDQHPSLLSSIVLYHLRGACPTKSEIFQKRLDPIWCKGTITT